MTPGSDRAEGAPQPPQVDGITAARAAGLRDTSDDQPGIRRVRCGRGFRYQGPDGRPVRDEDTLKRIRSLTIPPAWTDVWICPQQSGHLQATGRDARGRKQYRYHPRWRATRDESKYDRMVAFGLALPRIRARVEADLALPGLPRAKVLATVVRLLETTLVRVGNEEYARANGSFGLTTLRTRHVAVTGATIHFAFRGKSGVRHHIDVRDRRLARVVRRCRDLPGQLLFQYLDESGQRHGYSADVNDYLREAAGEEFTAKDFRTWGGTVLAVATLRGFAAVASRPGSEAGNPVASRTSGPAPASGPCLGWERNGRFQLHLPLCRQGLPSCLFVASGRSSVWLADSLQGGCVRFAQQLAQKPCTVAAYPTTAFFPPGPPPWPRPGATWCRPSRR
jgi:DNA topoisomerase-1